MSNIELVLDSAANNSFSSLLNQKKLNNNNNNNNNGMNYPQLRLSWYIYIIIHINNFIIFIITFKGQKLLQNLIEDMMKFFY